MSWRIKKDSYIYWDIMWVRKALFKEIVVDFFSELIKGTNSISGSVINSMHEK